MSGVGDYKNNNDLHDRMYEMVSGLISSEGKIETIGVDKTTDTLILPITELKATTTLAATGVYDARTITLTSATGVSVGQCLRIIDQLIDRYYCGRITGLVGTTATLETPLDATYTAGAQVVTANGNLNVNGSITPITFKLRHGSPSISQTVVVTRLMFGCVANSAVDLSKFANITPLSNGMVIRVMNSHTKNIFTIKSNIDLATIAYDFDVQSATNPQQGVDGFVCRFTFTDLGTSLRVEDDGNLEIIVQDDLTGITKLSMWVEGHEV